MTTGRLRAFSGSQVGPVPGRHGPAQCRAVIPGQSIARNGAAAEDSASVILRPEITSRAPARSTRLSYEEVGSWARKEPLPATPIMADSGGGWIVTRWVFEDRARV